MVDVAAAPAPALRDEPRGEAHALDQLEEAVLLPVAEHSLGPGQHGVVVRQDRAGAALPEEVAVDPSGSRHEPVGGCPLDQLAQIAPLALGGDREAAVLDERTG